MVLLATAAAAAWCCCVSVVAADVIFLLLLLLLRVCDVMNTWHSQEGCSNVAPSGCTVCNHPVC